MYACQCSACQVPVPVPGIVLYLCVSNENDRSYFYTSVCPTWTNAVESCGIQDLRGRRKTPQRSHGTGRATRHQLHPQTRRKNQSTRTHSSSDRIHIDRKGAHLGKHRVQHHSRIGSCGEDEQFSWSRDRFDVEFNKFGLQWDRCRGGNAFHAVCCIRRSFLRSSFVRCYCRFRYRFIYRSERCSSDHPMSFSP